MTLQQLRTQIRQHTVILPMAHLSDAQIDEFIWTAIERMQQAADWRFQHKSVVLPAPPSTPVALPADFVVEAAVYQQMDDGGLVPMALVEGGRRAVAAEDVRQSGNESYPKPSPAGSSYYIWAMNLYVVPDGSDPINVQIDYYCDVPMPLSPNDETGFLLYHPRAVLWGALQTCYLYLHEMDLANAVGQVYTDLVASAAKRDEGFRIGAKQEVRGR